MHVKMFKSGHITSSNNMASYYVDQYRINQNTWACIFVVSIRRYIFQLILSVIRSIPTWTHDVTFVRQFTDHCSTTLTNLHDAINQSLLINFISTGFKPMIWWLAVMFEPPSYKTIIVLLNIFAINFARVWPIKFWLIPGACIINLLCFNSKILI